MNCLTTASLMLFISYLPTDAVTMKSNTVIIEAEKSIVVWKYIDNDIWTIEGSGVCKKIR